MEQVADALINGLKEYFEKSGFSKAVVGLSGGVDSAVTAAIAMHALGKENVTGLLLPHSEFSSDQNLEDAREIANILTIKTKEVWIDNFARPFLELPWSRKDMTRGNILARVRMMILYSWANEHNALVLGTCNKSETLLGYETKYGDGASDVAVLGDLWKTEVWQLAKYLRLPDKFITKAPSAELYHGHTDEGEMGFSYEFADEVLKKWEKGINFEDSSDEKVKNILKRVKMSEHKRKMLPVIAKAN